MGSKTTAYPDSVLLSLLKTRLSKSQSVQQMYASSVLEAEAANPLPTDLAPETEIAAKKRSAVFLDTVLIAFERRLKAAATCSNRRLKGELYSSKNQEDVAIRDTESAMGALDSMLMKCAPRAFRSRSRRCATRSTSSFPGRSRRS